MRKPRPFCIASKDLRQVFQGGSGPVQAVLLGLLLVFIFSLSAAPGEQISLQAATAIFWLASSFSLVLIFNTLFHLEEENEVATALLMAPVSPQGVWLGKALGGMILLLLTQLFFLPAIIVFLGVEPPKDLLAGGLLVLGVDAGLTVLGSLLGAVSQGSEARDSLLSIIVFPLQIPLLLGGIKVGAALLGGEPVQGYLDWFGLIGAFDAVFLGAALLLFPFVFGSE